MKSGFRPAAVDAVESVCNLLRRMVLPQEAESAPLGLGVGVVLNGAEQLLKIGGFEAWDFEFCGLFVLHSPDAAEVMVAVRTDGSIGGSVLRPTGVVVNDGLVVEVDHVEGAIGADSGFDRTEPEVLAADKF